VIRIGSTVALDRLLEDAITSAALPGIVCLVATTSDMLYQAALGVRDVRSGAAMTLDTVFGIASMTKAITATAVLQLTEARLLRLDQPVADALPAFGKLHVLTGFDGDMPVLRAPARQATVRDLLANVSGLGYDTWCEDLWRYHATTGVPNISAGTRRTFAVPLIADPGTRFTYGTGTDWAGLVVERVSGLSLETYFREHITGPLGMHDTDVQLTDEQRDRSAAVHVRHQDVGWMTQPRDDSADPPEFYAGGHCLYSTPADYLLFQRMLLSGGTLAGTRILQEASVASMLSNQIGPLDIRPARSCNPDFCRDLTFPAGTKWGLGLTVSGADREGMRPAGSAGWAGVFNTAYWVDVANGLAVALYSQTLPFMDSAIMDIFAEFEQVLYHSLLP
jgi:methyl acetate hydrolase